MSPARARTSREEIVAAGRACLEAGGVDAVTMVAVAERVGIRAPSLYKWYPDRGSLLAAIAGAALEELGEALMPLSLDVDPASGVRRVAAAYRTFAHTHQRTYGLLFMELPSGSRPPAEANARASAPLVGLTERLVGPEHALEAARVVTAFAHGFVSMELSGAFRLGGDIDRAFRYGIDVLVDALTTRVGRGRAATGGKRVASSGGRPSGPGVTELGG
jgi:AcrR family transcriptional regulator